jgi:hypothetical protein
LSYDELLHDEDTCWPTGLWKIIRGLNLDEPGKKVVKIVDLD